MASRERAKPWAGRTAKHDGYSAFWHVLGATTRRAFTFTGWAMLISASSPSMQEQAGKIAIDVAVGADEMAAKFSRLFDVAQENVVELDAGIRDNQHKITDGDRFSKRLNHRRNQLESSFWGRFMALRNARKPARVHNAEGRLVESHLSVIDYIRDQMMAPTSLPAEMQVMQETLKDFSVGMAWLESGFSHTAYHTKSKASGLFQFIPDTWELLTANWPFKNARPNIRSTDHQVYALRTLFIKNYAALTEHPLTAPALSRIRDKYFGGDDARYKNEFIAPLLTYSHFCGPEAVAEAVAYFETHYPGPEVMHAEGVTRPLEKYDLASMFANHIAHETRRPTMELLVESGTYTRIRKFGPHTRDYFELMFARAMRAKDAVPEMRRSETLPPTEEKAQDEILEIPTERPNPTFAEEPEPVATIP
jgi:hypothetical protein